MINFANLLTIMFILLIGFTSFRLWNVQKNRPYSTNLLENSIGFISIMLIASLIWRGTEQAHLPLLNSDEITVALTVSMLILYLYHKLPHVGLVGVVLFLGVAIYQTWTTSPHLGLESLWFAALLGHSFIVVGIAGLYWLMILAFLTHIQGKYPIPALPAHEDGVGVPTPTLPFEGEGVGAKLLQLKSDVWGIVMDKLQTGTTIIIFVGSCLLILRSWWGWGGDLRLASVLTAFLTSLIAAWWLRFIIRVRPRLQLFVILLAFIIALLVLSMI